MAQMVFVDAVSQRCESEALVVLLLRSAGVDAAERRGACVSHSRSACVLPRE
jgi:hypothetical protein